jgi:hypothetical protein
MTTGNQFLRNDARLLGTAGNAIWRLAQLAAHREILKPVAVFGQINGIGVDVPKIGIL